MAKLPKRDKDNFIEALMAHAGYAPLVPGKSYKYRRHTGAGSYINDEKRATKQQIRLAYRRLGVRASDIPQHNPRRVRANSTTLRNLAVVKITRNRDGTVGIVARRNTPGRTRANWSLSKAKEVYSHQRKGGTSRGTSLKRAITQRNRRKARKR